MKVVIEIERLSRGYVRKGGKDNRRQQRARMIAFAAFCAQMGANSIGQIGKSHVIAYWKSTSTLSEKTRYSHWRALVTLWGLAGKAGLPPEPLKPPL